MAEIRYEPFDRATHQRDAFCCGKPALDDFLHSLVSQYEKRKLGRTFVAVTPGENQVLGYYTLASGSLPFDNLPAKVTRKMPKHPIPVVLLARLAVDQIMQGKGLGHALLMDALHRVLDLSKSLGVYAVEVDAIDAAGKAFYEKYGFTPLPDHEFQLYLPITTIEKAFDSQ